MTWMRSLRWPTGSACWSMAGSSRRARPIRSAPIRRCAPPIWGCVMLVVEGLQAGYGEAQVLHDIHLSVGQGQVVTLLGRNGMGKTTTISTIFGLLAARGGRVSIDGRDVTRAAPHRIARAGLGLVPRGGRCFRRWTCART
ncbi:ATP-binding cassette domain-containing protein [Paracoccus marcusii]|uniref:ATP-binding cassette domain-containing protein n=1 Tax=Paracoccus marcusii TaxID=59779 RepID=UPI002ED1EAE7|nr:ATP-binding cassette domain-containing protein [Paracoccus marcusii]